MPRERTFLAKAACLHCRRQEVCRGLCQTHYNALLDAVKKEKTTWAALERAGKSRKKERSFTETILEGIA